MVFNALFQYVFSYSASVLSPCAQLSLFTNTPHKILFNPKAVFPHNHCRNIDSGEREINPAKMT